MSNNTFTEIVITPESGTDFDSGKIDPTPSSKPQSPLPTSPSSSTSTSSQAPLPTTSRGLDEAPAMLSLMSQLSSGQIAPVVSAVFSSLSSRLGKDRPAMVPWKDMFDTDRFKLWGPYTQRVPQNLHKFTVNYAIFTFLLTIYAILTTPGLLLTIIVLGGIAVYLFQLRADPIVLGGHQLTHSQKLVSFLTFSSLIVILTTPASSSFLWVVLVAALSISAHALFFQSDEERPDQYFISV